MCIPSLGRLALVLWCLAGGLDAASRPPEPTLGRQEFAAGDFAAAEAAFTRALTLNRSDPALYHNRAIARFNQQKYAEARADLSAYVALRPKDAAAFALRARVSSFLGDFPEALADTEAALAVDPGNTDALLVRGRVRTARGQFEEAIADFDRVLLAQPGDAEAHVGRGDAHLARRDPAAAKADFERASALAPADPDASFKLGLALFRLLELNAAIRTLAAADTLAPGSPLVARTLGYAHYAAGDHLAATTAFRRAIALAPNDASYARIALRLCERRLGQPDSAASLDQPDAANDDWPRMIERYLNAAATEDYLLLAAENLAPVSARSGRRCEAHFYIGTMYLLAGNHDSAQVHFREAIATNESSFAEHVLARAELGRLKDLPVQPKRRSLRLQQ